MVLERMKTHGCKQKMCAGRSRWFEFLEKHQKSEIFWNFFGTLRVKQKNKAPEVFVILTKVSERKNKIRKLRKKQ